MQFFEKMAVEPNILDPAMGFLVKLSMSLGEIMFCKCLNGKCEIK